MDKRTLTFGIFLILVFTLGCVSAAENTTTGNATSIAQNYHEDVVEVSMAFDVALNPDRPIEYGSDILFDVMVPEGASGSIDYTVNSKNFNINVENLYDDAETLGEAGIRVHADELVYGLNTFTFTYIGDDYPKTTVTQKLTVEGNIKPDTVYVGYGNDAHVSLMLPGDASGNLNVYEVIFYDLPEDIWGYGARFNLIQSVPLINGFANVTVSSLNPGRHYIYANYTGKDYAAEFKYSISNITLAEAIYSKYDYDAYFDVIPNMNLPSIAYTTNEYTIDFRLPEDYEGVLTVTVGSEKRTFQVKNGVTSFKLFNLESASHSEGELVDDIKVQIHYQDKWSAYTYNETYLILVSKGGPTADFEITEYAKNILKGETNTISLAFPDYVHGKLTIFLDGVKIAEQTIDGPTDEYLLSTEKLSYGKHTVKLIYNDDNGLLKSKSLDFEVSYIVVEYPSAIEIGTFSWMEVSNTIAVRMPDDATGNVKIMMNGTKIAEGNIIDGSFSFDVEGISLGVYEFEVTYLGNYPAFSTRFALNSTYVYDVDISDIVYGQTNRFALRLPLGATGNVTLKIGERTFVSAISEDGEAIFDVDGFVPGTYGWSISYGGDGKFPAFKSDESINVIYKITTNIDDSDEVFRDGNITFTLVLPADAKGNLIISRYDEINNLFEVLRTLPVTGGRAQVSLYGLNLGFNEYKAEYDGKDFDVDVYDEFIYVVNRIILPESKGIIVGNDAVYEIQLADAVNSTISVYVDDRLVKQVDFINGRAEVVLKNMDIGLYNVRFECGKIWSSNVYLAVNEAYSWKITPKIKLGEGNVFEVNFPKNTNGTLNFAAYYVDEIYSRNISKTISMPYTRGFAAIPSTEFLVGEYRIVNFTITDSVYGVIDFAVAGNNSVSFVIENKADIYAFINGTVLTVEFPNDAVGEVTVKIGKKTYIRDIIDGRATVSNVDNDLKRVIVSYMGSQYYSPFDDYVLGVRKIIPENPDPVDEKTENHSVEPEVKKYDPKIIASNLASTYNGGVYYNVKVYGTDGNPAGGKSVTFKLNGKKLTAVKTDSKGVAKVKITSTPGSYKITSTSLGVSVTKKLTIRQVLKLTKVTPKKSAKKLVLTASLVKVNGKYLKGKTIVFRFSGKNYKVKTNGKGIAKLTIKSNVLKKLKAGKKITYQATYLKCTVKRSAKVIK